MFLLLQTLKEFEVDTLEKEKSELFDALGRPVEWNRLGINKVLRAKLYLEAKL